MFWPEQTARPRSRPDRNPTRFSLASQAPFLAGRRLDHSGSLASRCAITIPSRRRPSSSLQAGRARFVEAHSHTSTNLPVERHALRCRGTGNRTSHRRGQHRRGAEVATNASTAGPQRRALPSSRETTARTGWRPRLGFAGFEWRGRGLFVRRRCRSGHRGRRVDGAKTCSRGATAPAARRACSELLRAVEEAAPTRGIDLPINRNDVDSIDHPAWFDLGAGCGAGQESLARWIDLTRSNTRRRARAQMSRRRRAQLLVDELSQLSADGPPLGSARRGRGGGQLRRADRTGPKDRRALSRRGSEDAGGRRKRKSTPSSGTWPRAGRPDDENAPRHADLALRFACLGAL